MCGSAWPGWLVRVPAPFRDCLAPRFLALCKAKEVKQEVATSSQKELCHIQLPWHFSALCFPTFPRNAKDSYTVNRGAELLACDQGRQRHGSSGVRRGRQSSRTEGSGCRTLPRAGGSPSLPAHRAVSFCRVRVLQVSPALHSFPERDLVPLACPVPWSSKVSV